MADDKNGNGFIGGGMSGIATPTPAATPGETRRVRDRGVVVTGPAARVTELRDKREPLDPMGEVLFTDTYGRPYELHPGGVGWEKGRGMMRRFAVGQELWLIMRITLRDEYIQMVNQPEFLAELSAKLPGYDVSKLGHLPYLESYEYRVQVVEPAPGKTISVGLLPLYVAEVITGPATGLRFLAYPSDLMDDSNLDGHGIDRILRRKKDGLDIPKGFVLKKEANGE